MNYKPELLAPAGDLSKLKIAVLYGADAVFIGGKEFSLRAKASNFTISEIEKGVIFAHNHGSKIYVTVNIYPHNQDLEGLDEYLLALNKINIDAIIVSSLYIVTRAKELGCSFEVHLSTQQSTANKYAVQFWKKLGADRIVLARELSLEDIEELNKENTLPLEVFIHGGMCSSFSGRCTLSNNLTNRDANRGGCAHSCRWYYDLYYQDKKIEEADFMMGSKDLMSFKVLEKLLDMKVASFKIEGRMKSLHYIATVISTYRRFIDEYFHNKDEIKDVSQYEEKISKSENRPLDSGFFYGDVTNKGMLYENKSEKPPQDFLGLVLEHEDEKILTKIEQRNYFEVSDKLEILEPSGKIYDVDIIKLLDEEKQPLDIARHAMQTLYLKLSKTPKPYSIIRKK